MNKAVLVSHLQEIAPEKELAALMKGVDAVVAGAPHTLEADGDDRLRAGDTADEGRPFRTVDAEGDPLLIVSTDGEHSYVGRPTVTFDDGFATIAPTPERLEIVLEHGVAAVGRGDMPGRFPQVAGLAFSFDPTAEAR